MSLFDIYPEWVIVWPNLPFPKEFLEFCFFLSKQVKFVH